MAGKHRRLGRRPPHRPGLLDRAAFSLFGLPPGQPFPLARLGEWVHGHDVPAVESFQDRLLRRGETATAAFRIIRGDDASVRQLRAFARPVSGPTGR